MKTRDQAVEPFVYIVGAGRSGTTLLMSMLDAHEEIAMLPETAFIRRYLTRQRQVAKASTVRRLLGEDRLLKRLDLQSCLLDEFAACPSSEVAWSDVYRTILRLHGTRTGKRHVGGKDPKTVECLPVLCQAFPSVKVIHMIRDPRDVFLSRQKADWSANRHWFAHAMAYRIHFGLGQRAKRELPVGSYEEVKYEELVRDPVTTLQRLCAFLGVEYDHGMLRFHETAARLVAEDEAAWKANVLRPLLRDNTGKWRSALSPTQLLRIESVCHPVFQQGYYIPNRTDLPLGSMIFSLTLRFLARTAEWTYSLRPVRGTRWRHLPLARRDDPG